MPLILLCLRQLRRHSLLISNLNIFEQVFSWPMSRNAPPNSPSITSVDDGPVLAARFSLDGKLLAIQRSETEVSIFNREKGLKFSQLCRSRTDRILGFFWTDCPTCNIVYVTNR